MIEDNLIWDTATGRVHKHDFHSSLRPPDILDFIDYNDFSILVIFLAGFLGISTRLLKIAHYYVMRYMSRAQVLNNRTLCAVSA